MTDTFAIEDDISSKIKQVDWEKACSPRRDIEGDEGIDDYGDYAVIDDFLTNPDEMMEALLTCPSNFLDQIIKMSHNESGKFPFGVKQPGLEQVVPPTYILPLLHGVYKSLVDCEFVPGDCNEYLNPKKKGVQEWMENIPAYSETKAITHYDGCLCNDRAHFPEFSKWEFNALIFMNDHDNASFDLYDLKWKDKYYSCAEDIMSEDQQVVEDIVEWLDGNAIPTQDSMVYEPFQDTDQFVKTRSVEIKKNRLVLFKGHTFRTINFSGGKDLYHLHIGMNQMPKHESDQPKNEFINDDTYS